MTPRATIRLPFNTAKEKDAAAYFINALIAEGSAVFNAILDAGGTELLIEFTGGY